MPELPEVETVVRELNRMLPSGLAFEGVVLLRPDLRDPIPQKQIQRLKGEELLRVERRAKYILFVFPRGVVISHLGMTGAWRRLRPREKLDIQKHDHLTLQFAKGLRLAFRDPRRFGILDVHLGNDFLLHKRLASLGQEPLDRDFGAGEFFSLLHGVKAPIKTHLMNQKVLVGVGNIYASEALFRARVRPTRAAGRITRQEADRLYCEIRDLLEAAIAAGGSTIRDYRSLDSAGEFQSQHFVYGREGEACRICHTRIQNRVMAGRSTFWCSNCQQ